MSLTPFLLSKEKGLKAVGVGTQSGVAGGCNVVTSLQRSRRVSVYDLRYATSSATPWSARLSPSDSNTNASCSEVTRATASDAASHVLQKSREAWKLLVQLVECFKCDGGKLQSLFIRQSAVASCWLSPARHVATGILCG